MGQSSATLLQDRMMMHHKHATQGTPTQVALDGITFYSK